MESNIKKTPNREFQSNDKKNENFITKLSYKNNRKSYGISHGVDNLHHSPNKEEQRHIFKKLIENNKNWIKTNLTKDPDFVNRFSQSNDPKYLIIACSDSKISFSEVTETKAADSITHRNIGNLVLATDFNVQSVIQYAVENLKVKHIIVLGHTNCAAIKACLANKYLGLIDHWLQNIKEVAEKHKDELLYFQKEYPDLLIRKLVELNIKEQVLNICKTPTIQKAWNLRQEIYIHGCLFESETGFLNDLKIMQNEWVEIEDIYKLEMQKINI